MITMSCGCDNYNTIHFSVRNLDHGKLVDFMYIKLSIKLRKRVLCIIFKKEWFNSSQLVKICLLKG